jgi:glycosyltransferase involved in cell wall biosynthesis
MISSYIMHILVIQDYLRCGGTEMQSISLTAGFHDSGWNATLLTIRPKGPLFPRVLKKKIRIKSLQPLDLKINWLHPGLVRAIAKLSPDAILLMGRTANCLGNKISRNFPSIPVIGSLRTGRKLPPAYHSFLMNCPHIVANSCWAANQLRERGIQDRKISVIPNGNVCDLNFGKRVEIRKTIREKFNIPPETTVFLKIAAFIPGKNHEELFKILQRVDKPFELWLAGNGPTENTCKKHVANLNLKGTTRFLGQISELSGLYFGSDIAVLTSQEESMPNFIVESQTAGLPVVAYDCAGVSETFIPDESGFLIRQGDRNTFLHQLEILHKNINLRQSMGAKGRLWALEQFDAAERLQDYMRIISKIVNK